MTMAESQKKAPQAKAARQDDSVMGASLRIWTLLFVHKLTPVRPTTAALSLSAAWSDCIILMNLISSATSSKSRSDERRS